MAKRNKSYQRGKHVSPAKLGLARGVVPIRRELDPSSYGVLEDATKELRKDIRGAGRMYRRDSLSVTVIGLSRMTKRILEEGPPTADVVDAVEACTYPVEVKLGALGMYGRNNQKLGYELHSEELYEQREKIEELYMNLEHRGKKGSLALQDDIIAGPNSRLHCTVGQLYNEQAVAHFSDIRVLEHYSGAIGSVVLLQSVQLMHIGK